jgi:alkylation response protein AidB-like acyl-CoA dehydrogenase
MTDTIEDVDAFRARARAWIEANLEPKADAAGRERTRDEEKALQAKLFDAGFAGFAFPTEYGGAGLTLDHQVAFFQEAADHVTPQIFGVSIGMLAPTLLDCGSETLKQRHIPKMLRADEDFIQLLSEPSGGSDMAGAMTRATRDGDTWVINGSKMWSSGALHATFGMLLARTNWDMPKHRGLSMFVLPLRDYPGVTIEPIREVNGDLEHAHFCQEYFDDVTIPADFIIGEENEGWTVAQRLLFHERNATVGIGFGHGFMGGGGASARRAAMRANPAAALVEVAARRGANKDGATRQLIGEAYVDSMAHTYARTRVMAGQRAGKLVGQWGSLLKLGEGLDSPAYAALAMDVAAADGVIWTDERPGGDQGKAWLSSRGISIAGGSNEMQRNIVSERLLGLPREHDPSRELAFSEIQRRRSESRG